MNAFAEAWSALLGWLALAQGREATAWFNLGRAGLVNAVGCYVAVALLSILVAMLVGEPPGWTGTLIYLALQLPPLLTVWLVIGLSGTLVRPAGGATGLLVVASYAMAIISLARIPLALVAAPGAFANLLLGVLAFMLYRAGRGIGGWSIGISVAFALLAAAALVTETVGLYMLLTGGEGIG